MKGTMTMNKLNSLSRYLILGLALLAAAPILAPLPAYAQTSVTTTILSTAATESSTVMVVASATSITANQSVLYIDREAMRVIAVSGTSISVRRGTDGTKAVAHRINSLIWVGATPDVFVQADPSGACTQSTDQAYQPLINTLNGNIWNCQNVFSNVDAVGSTGSTLAPTASLTNGIWSRVNDIGTGFSLPYRTVANAAYTASYGDFVIDYNSATAGRTVTLPAITGVYGKVYVIKNNVNNQNITVATTASQWIVTVGTTTAVVTPGDARWFISSGGGWTTF